ncbi:putative F-box protein At3g58860 [Arachis ipaensis]|uniref:Uncharacterized protein n=1 Tax=Arachis hypogaea TaxID=3818 RepID=A0A444ZIQ3_ARAHY|nr:putative F-box protein At3g58860 [Arachis ipaensis]XP_025644896.1 putative F-box protein At3g58860 [Arachis hypogaea]QHO07295.1 Putative F-box protein [Arachis hypogaea]RYR14094.1 hypothetical protein Ahy_B04g070740 [Arachis hypogaea]
MCKSEKKSRLEEEDRLSNLTDDVLCHVLSFLDTQSACKTSTLSKSWHHKSLWALLPHVSFSYFSYSFRQNPKSHFQSFNRFINRVLNSYQPLQQQNQGNKRFSLNYHSDSSFEPNQFNKWIRGALERNAEEIEVNVDLTMVVQVPVSVFSSVTLTTLKLQGEATLYSLYFPPCLCSLKVLSLKMRQSDATELVSTLLSSCPVLEEFYFDGFCGTMRITAAPKLKKVVVNNESFMWSTELFEIDAPSLEYFSLKDMDPERYVVKNLDNVMEAEFSIMLDMRKSSTGLFNLLHGLSSVKSLHVNISFEGSLPEISTDDVSYGVKHNLNYMNVEFSIIVT